MRLVWDRESTGGLGGREVVLLLLLFVGPRGSGTTDCGEYCHASTGAVASSRTTSSRTGGFDWAVASFRTTSSRTTRKKLLKPTTLVT